MDNSGITPVMNVGSGYGYDNAFGGNGLWLFAILALMWGGGGMFGARGVDGRVATVEDLNTTTNFARLESQVQGIGEDAQRNYTNLTNGLCDLGYRLAVDKGDLARQISECCCATQRGIDSVNYNGALNTASINATTVAQTQKILDALCADKLSAMQSRISQLELEKALCGVVRYPAQVTYTAGCSPFGFGAGCCTTNI